MTYIAYYRVSTGHQERSGLGLEAQQADVKRFIGDNQPIAEYTEVESGGNNNRPKLEEALLQCKKTGSTLVIAKLDRLSRSILLIETIKSKGISFVCADMPEADEMMLCIHAVFAQIELKKISRRIKEALEAKRARGEKWGGITPNHPKDHMKTMRDKRGVSKINEAVAEVVERELSRGATLRQTATKLNDLGHRTFEGKPFGQVQIMRLRDRLKKEEV